MAHTSMDAIISGLAQLHAASGSAISELSGKLTAESTELAELRARVTGIAAHIRELHGIEISDLTLGSVITEHQTRSDFFKKELTEKREAFDREMIEGKRAWEKERAERARIAQEGRELAEKTRAREAEEYGYELAKKRAADEDRYQLNARQEQEALGELLAGKQKEWAAREKAIADQEKLYDETNAKVDEFAHKLEVAVKRASEEGGGIGRSQTKVKSDLLAKEIEGETRLAELKIKSLDAIIKDHATRIETLNQQLGAALQQAQHLAVKSIEGASNANTFSAIKEIALEQAKNLPKNK